MTESNLENVASDHFQKFQKWSESATEEFNSRVQTELDKYHTNMIIISPSKCVTYNKIKIPIKNIKTKTKNKFINRHVLKNLKPTNVTAKEQGDYKFSVDVTLTYDK